MSCNLTMSEISTYLQQNRPVSLYFTDSHVPAMVLDCAGKSVYIKHGPRKFWLRVNNKMVERVVVGR